MAGALHLSMRVPWRDQPWNEFVCSNPRDNASCVLHSAIGPKRDDEFESEHADASIDTLDQNRLPCLTERGMFMSPLGYTVVKRHPYRDSVALKGTLHDTALSVPPFAFESMPFRWLQRETLANEIGHDRVPGFNQDAEDAADNALGFSPQWLMDSDNQRAAIEAFYSAVDPGQSLVFVYLKHSPLQEERTERLLVGVARVTAVVPPTMWKQSGNPPFSSSMWETIVQHSLRPDTPDGILLPYQALVGLADDGTDISAALAWVPEGRATEFSYVTEHLSDDAAIEALSAIQRAADAARTLGLEVADAGIAWLKREIERLWQLRGPAPGLPGVLKQLGVEHPYVAAKVIASEVGEGGDPWEYLNGVFASPTTAPQPIRHHVGLVQAKVWKKLGTEVQDVMRLLSAFDISPDQVEDLLNGHTELELAPELLLDNPYFAATCTYGAPNHVPFKTVDRALFPPSHVSWQPPLSDRLGLDSHIDRRRIEALFADVLEAQGTQGDTLLPAGEVIALANEVDLAQPPNLNGMIVAGLDLDYASLVESDDWSPIIGVLLAGDKPGYKLDRFEFTSHVIREWIENQLGRPALGKLNNARRVLDTALKKNADITGPDDEAEDRARSEKAAGLSALHDAPLSVLIGPAGTGKTTLLRALVEHPGVAEGGVLLLAPTGKARVQLETKVNKRAQTLASYLTATDRYEGDTGRYLVRDDRPRRRCGLVVIDEASMLTEGMLAATLDSLASVRRIVLVGDPRQLPPIGAGRPFVDLVNRLRPAAFDGWIAVGDHYVELQVPRRQLADGSHGRRHDLELAAWFGDVGRGADDDAIWNDLAEQSDLPTVRYIPWGDRRPAQVIADVLTEALKLDVDDDVARAFALTYGAEINGGYVNWKPGAGSHAEDWQILSPTRSRAYGTVELNRQIKRTYRADDTARAQRNNRWNVPRPVGPELVVRGDKVMQTQNRRLVPWPKKDALNYVANGEIGVAIGRLVAREKVPQRNLPLKVEFSSQPGFSYSYWTSSADDPMLELAWAVTVHKSQGSEFSQTFLVLPAKTHVSRELLYTALTRQRNKVVILHDGDLNQLRELSQPWRSETARRLTDLFDAPDPVTIEFRGQARRFDRKLLHVSSTGIAMASKNEVIIADILEQLAPGQWEYEEPFIGIDGRTVHPDFRIAAADGRTIYWEHAGMLDRPDYARKWKLKQEWYRENGVLPHAEGGGERGVLMSTDDRGGVDVPAWRALAETVLGVTGSAGIRRGGPSRRGPATSPA